MDSLSPNIFVNDIQKTIEFYEKLGFSVVLTVPEQGDLVFALMSCDKVSFMFQTFESLGTEIPEIKREGGGSLLLYIKIKGIRDFYERIKDQVKIIKGLETTFYGATEFSIQDHNGYVLTFAEDD